MAEPEILAPAVLRRLAEIGRADLVVGIPSYQNARTIGHVVRAAQAGLAKYFPGLQSVILNSDGGSTDATAEVVASSGGFDAAVVLVSNPAHPIHRFTVPYHGVPGKGSAFRTVFRAADLLDAQACAVVDADLRSITPEWIHLLVAPIVEQGTDFVAPYYHRHKFDGTITNNIVYPLTRALYGKRVRQPIGGEFGVSRALLRHYLQLPVWETDVARFGIDIWMTTTAVCGDFRVCQAFLGAKLHDPKDPGADLAGMLVQVLGTVVSLMETHQDVWDRIEGSTPVPIVGFQYGVGVDPVRVDTARMIDHFRRGVRDLEPIWRTVYDHDTMARLRSLSSCAVADFVIDDRLWVGLIYDLAIACHLRVGDRADLVRAALPLYMGRVASFVTEIAEADATTVEARIEQLCAAFEEGKKDFRQRWADGRR
jgi:glucosylglycerate synthase